MELSYSDLTDKKNLSLRVKWINSLRSLMAIDAPKNKSGVALISDIDLVLSSEEQKLQAFTNIKIKQ